jgi:hypothetical protein
MNRNFLEMAFVSLFAVVAICSCDENEDENGDGNGNGLVGNTITVNVENGGEYDVEIDSVKANITISVTEKYDSKTNTYYYTKEIYTLTTAAYNNGKFTLSLPETVSDDLLDDDLIFEDYDKLPEGVIASDSELKGAPVMIEAYHNGKIVGVCYYTNEDKNWVGYLIYADRNFSLIGSRTEEDGGAYKWNVHLKKGWNMVYEKQNQKELTTTAPAGMKWGCYED